MYDNSHIQGSNAVGAMIVAGPEGFRKNQYRKFNIRSESLTPGDDFGMMREVLTRRFKRLLSEAPREPQACSTRMARAERVSAAERATASRVAASRLEVSPLSTAAAPSRTASRRPRGRSRRSSGRTKTNAEERPTPPGPISCSSTAAKASSPPRARHLAALGVTDVPLIGIAKGPERDAGRETFFMAGREPFRLRPRDPVLYFVQRLRDEAHRFAVGSHRQKRKKDIREAGLQEIPGIGPTRKRALLRHFGTLKAIERASVADLEHVPGINVETARKIYDFFHETAPRTGS